MIPGERIHAGREARSEQDGFHGRGKRKRFYRLRATPGEHDEIDKANREAFEEHFRIVKRAWSDDMMDFSGKFWQIPREGTPWDIDATKQWGAGAGGGG